jgi:two-component system, response regulator RpfG
VSPSRNATVVILDDQATSRTVLTKLMTRLDWAVSVVPFSDPVACLEWVKNNPLDLILVDHRMPGLTGIEFTQQFRAIARCVDIPLVIVTGVDDRNVRLRALEAGATDFLLKPVDFHECRARCHNLLTMHHQRELIRRRAATLESQVADAVEAIRIREQETLLRLARAGEYRDKETANHIERMAKYSRLIAEGLHLPVPECETLELAAPMHDIGKIGIPDTILLRPGRHTAAESVVMKQHTVIGYEILKDSPSPYLQIGALIALRHHEKYDGTGYPDNLRGDEIPLPARIVAVADVFDALTSQRPYKRPWPLEQSIGYIKQQAGTQFDPDCANAFLNSISKITEVYHSLRDTSDEDHKDSFYG